MTTIIDLPLRRDRRGRPLRVTTPTGIGRGRTASTNTGPAAVGTATEADLARRAPADTPHTRDIPGIPTRMSLARPLPAP